MVACMHRRWLVALIGVLACAGVPLAWAHHGGLGIEGDLVQWALKVDQWQAEVIDQGQRIKFLSYPRQPVLGSRTRLVFEIQSVATGQYSSGLKAEVVLQAPDGTQQTLALPEITGVTAYYEAALTFEKDGEHTITFRATAAGTPFAGTFRKTVGRSQWRSDWSTMLGYGVVLAAGAMTWIGFVLSMQRRFTPVR